MAKTLDDIAGELVGVELLCENCGTELNLFDDECSFCGDDTTFGIDGYYNNLREEALEKFEKLLKRRKAKDEN